MRFLSVCSGMEAASVAWEPLGWKAVGFSEIEPFPCAILKHRFPNTPNYGSLTEYQQWPLGPDSIDLLVGGTPCQSFSVAGLRKGLADPRGNLALTFLGLADKLRPRWIVWENVPGVLSSGGGRDFGSFLGALEQLGYGWAYRVLDAQHFGVPQRRRRVFVVASLGGRDVAASVLLKPESLCWHPAKGRKKGQATAPDAGSGVEAGVECATGKRTHALTASQKGATEDGTGRGTPIVIDRAAFNQGISAQYELHIERLIPCPDNDSVGTLCARDFKGVGNQFVQEGECIPCSTIPFRKSKRACSTTDNETWVEAEASNTLNNFDLGDTPTTHAVVEPQLYENHPNDSRITGPLDVAPTVVSRFGTGGGNVPPVNSEPHIVQVSELRLRGQITEKDICPTLTAGAKQGDTDPLAVHAITFQPGNLRREAGADPSTTTTTTTIKASAGDQMPHVAVVQQGVDLYNQTLTGDVHVPLRTAGGHGAPACLTPMAVRRLTPVECERLQGFPDNWSRIPWKGKPEDQCPDGPRYKACGNSMAVPVMRWIGEQIARVELSHNPTNQTNA